MRADNGDDDDDAKTPAFRCLDAARYTVAALVSILIIAVIVTTVKVVLRPDSLRLTVVDGTIYSSTATPQPQPAPANKTVSLQLNLRAENPSGRARMYLLDATAYLFAGGDGGSSAATKTPEEDCVILFYLPDKAVPQERMVDLVTNVEAKDDPDVMDQTYFDLLYDDDDKDGAGGGGGIGDATLRVDGRLVTEVNSGFNMTGLMVTYYCRPLLVGDGEAAKGRKDVLCTDNLGTQ